MGNVSKVGPMLLPCQPAIMYRGHLDRLDSGFDGEGTMDIYAFGQALTGCDADVLAVGLQQDQPLPSDVQAIDEALDGQITRILESDDGITDCGKLTEIHCPATPSVKLLLLIGLGSPGKLDVRSCARAYGAAAKQLARKSRSHVVFSAEGLAAELASAAVANAIIGCTGQDLYRSEKNYFPWNRLGWHGINDGELERGQILGESVNVARRLVNEPAGHLYPEAYADHVVQLFENEVQK